MVRKLRCKDAIRLKKTTGGRNMTEEVINQLWPKDVDEQMATELHHFGYLTFKWLSKNRQIEFDEDVRLRTNRQSPTLPPQLVEVARQISMLETVDDRPGPQIWLLLHLNISGIFGQHRQSIIFADNSFL
jgi:hypothetical protein